MKIIDPGPKAIWHHGHNSRGLMSVNVEFEADRDLFKALVEMLNADEKFYALTGSYKVPVRVSEIFRPAPAIYKDEPLARVRLHSVGAPEPYMQIGLHARPGFVVPPRLSLEAEASIKGVLGTVERLMRSGARVDISKDLPMDGRSFDSVYGLRGSPTTTITVKGKDEGMTLPTIPKLWDVPPPIYKVPMTYHDVMYRPLNYHLCDPPYARRYCPIEFTAGAMDQARSRLTRSVREKIDALLTGTLETKHKEKKVMDKKALKANRFYVGSERALRTGWGKPTLAEAVEHAKQLQAETGDDQFVVQIVRVVKKKEQPVIVEAVK